MVNELDEIPNPTLRERAERAVIKPILSTKANFGLGNPYVKSKKKFVGSEMERSISRGIAPTSNKAKRKVIVKGIDKIWAADLIDMQAFAEYNDGVKYLLSIIDVFFPNMVGLFH